MDTVENGGKVDLPLLHGDDDFANMDACMRCVADGGGCCTGKGSGIFVTLHDVLRIHEKTKKPLNEIASFGKVSPGHEKSVKESDPFLFQYYRDSSVLQLRRTGDHCGFLVEGRGCTVFDHRPAICRLFPFTFDFKKGDGSVKIVIPKAEKQKDEDCSIVQENFYRSNGQLFKAMNTSREILEKLAQQHVKEIRIYGTYINDIAAGMPLDKVIVKHNITV